jgi:carboxymethylenebutenolidase
MAIITSDVDIVSGYMARPMDEDQHPGIVVIQEWWGLDEHIKDVTRRFANEGYVALAPDLYHGTVTNDPQQAMKLVGGLDRARATRDTQAATGYLKGQASSNGKVAVIGYCMGGGIALLAACQSGIDAALVYYGGLPEPLDQLDGVSAPVLAAYGSDEGDKGRQLEQELRNRGKQVQLHVYEGANHAFFNDQGQRHDAAASADVWEKTLAFLKSNVA